MVPYILLVMIIISSSIGFIFGIPVAVAALMLDFYPAFLISIIGLTIGAMISFGLARVLGRDYMEKHFIHKIKRLEHYDEHLKKRGFITVFILRVIYFVPYELINIASGFSRVSVFQYALGTFFGIMPGTLLTLYFIKSTNNLHSFQFAVITAIFTAFCLLPLLSKRVRRIIVSG